MARIQVRDASCERLIEADAPVDRIAAGFAFAEGPVCHGRERFLICSDIPHDAFGALAKRPTRLAALTAWPSQGSAPAPL